jgi:hypothetical protein
MNENHLLPMWSFLVVKKGKTTTKFGFCIKIIMILHKKNHLNFKNNFQSLIKTKWMCTCLLPWLRLLHHGFVLFAEKRGHGVLGWRREWEVCLTSVLSEESLEEREVVIWYMTFECSPKSSPLIPTGLVNKKYVVWSKYNFFTHMIAKMA